ncbi:MAG: hypothetical protein GY749_29745, partial [Desulfobacteraceae bacterium]|nr:hypothetical protein [Desulfobacteraceae bacterium]
QFGCSIGCKDKTEIIRYLGVFSRNLENIFEHFEQYADWTYSVAWIDCLAKGNDLGRSILMIGEHADDGFLHLPRNKKIFCAC